MSAERQEGETYAAGDDRQRDEHRLLDFGCGFQNRQPRSSLPATLRRGETVGGRCFRRRLRPPVTRIPGSRWAPIENRPDRTRASPPSNPQTGQQGKRNAESPTMMASTRTAPDTPAPPNRGKPCRRQSAGQADRPPERFHSSSAAGRQKGTMRTPAVKNAGIQLGDSLLDLGRNDDRVFAAVHEDDSLDRGF